MIFMIETAHQPINVPDGHDCARLHGHLFRIEIHDTADLGERTRYG